MILILPILNQNMINVLHCIIILCKIQLSISAHNEQDSMKHGEKSFSIRTYKGRASASELVMLRGGLPSEIALQLQGEALSPKLCITIEVQTSKNRKNIFGSK